MSLANLNPGKVLFCRAINSVGLSVPIDTTNWTPILFDGNRYDNSGGAIHSITENTGRFVAPIAGLYQAWIGLQANFTGRLTVGAFLNGSTQISLDSCDQSGVFNSIPSSVWRFQAGEYLEWKARSNSSIATIVRVSAHSLEATFTYLGAY